MLSRAGVRFVDLVVGSECLVGDDEGDFDCGLPPCWFDWSAARAVVEVVVCAVARLVVARPVARMSCVLVLDV